MRTPINPFITNILLDSCAFDPKYGQKAIASQELLNNEELNIMIAHSNMKEIEHPGTPAHVKLQAQARIFTIPTSLTRPELEIKNKILQILAGNGKPENMQKDAEHVFEAQKYGSYFVTTDSRIIKKRDELSKLSVSCFIMLPSELLEIIEQHSNLNLKP